MMGISFTCPGCGAQIPVSDGADPSSCPRCGYAIAGSPSGGNSVRRCMNCKTELRGGATVCPQCGTDQETGRRSFGSGKRKQEGVAAEGGKLDDKSLSLSTVIALAVLAVGIAVCVFFLSRSPSSSESGLPPPKASPITPPRVQTARVEAQPVSPAQPATTTTAARVRHAPVEDPLKAALSRYEAALRQGRLDTAQQTRLQIEHRFAGAQLPAAFWKQTFAPTSCVSVTLYYVCTVCNDGSCPVCHNVPCCASCKGTGTCSACGGNPNRQVPCQSCVCQTCDGSGRCSTCSASGTAGCQACNAMGYTEQRNVIACGSCGGTGQRRGLKTANGYMPIKCMTCGGSGRISQVVRIRCATCNGQGRIQCPACAGNTLCQACRGTGRTAVCAACGGKGSVEVVCKTCTGSKKCPTCSGAGHCQRCLGAGNCYLCRKTGLVREVHLPAPVTWLNQTAGYFVFDAANQKILRSGDKAGHQEIQCEGRLIVFDVAPNEVVWISTAPSFQQMTRLFAPK